MNEVVINVNTESDDTTMTGSLVVSGGIGPIWRCVICKTKYMGGSYHDTVCEKCLVKSIKFSKDLNEIYFNDEIVYTIKDKCWTCGRTIPRNYKQEDRIGMFDVYLSNGSIGCVGCPR